MAEQVDVVVLSMGVGGEAVAGTLAEAGLSVVGVESNLLGGECRYWACIPSKMMLRAGEVVAEGRRVPELAGTSTVTRGERRSPGAFGKRPLPAGTTRSRWTGSLVRGTVRPWSWSYHRAR